MKKTPVVVVPEGDEAQPIEIIENAIITLAEGMKKFDKSRLKQSAIVTLLVRSSGVNRTDVEKIMDCLADLETLYLKK